MRLCALGKYHLLDTFCDDAGVFAAEPAEERGDSHGGGAGRGGGGGGGAGGGARDPNGNAK